MPISVLVSARWQEPRVGQDEVTVLSDDTGWYLAERGEEMLVSAIAPVGTDAVFNMLQAPRLVRELSDAAAEAPDADIAATLTELAAFIQARMPSPGQQVDYYVLFLSD